MNYRYILWKKNSTSRNRLHLQDHVSFLRSPISITRKFIEKYPRKMAHPTTSKDKQKNGAHDIIPSIKSNWKKAISFHSLSSTIFLKIEDDERKREKTRGHFITRLSQGGIGEMKNEWRPPPIRYHTLARVRVSSYQWTPPLRIFSNQLPRRRTKKQPRRL